jgi:hypothetical protein
VPSSELEKLVNVNEKRLNVGEVLKSELGIVLYACLADPTKGREVVELWRRAGWRNGTRRVQEEKHRTA